jgi:hypothetical protein
MPWHASGRAKAAATTPAASLETWLLSEDRASASEVECVGYLEAERRPTVISEGQHQASWGNTGW